MELIILGSSAAIPVPKRSLSSIALKYKSHVILFDTGEDLQRRYNEAGLKFNKLLKIFISHFHGDHIIGLPGLLFRFGFIERTAPVFIYGPRNLYLYLFLHRKILGLKTNYPLIVREINHDNKEIVEYLGLESTEPTEIKKLSDDIVDETSRYFVKYALMKHSVITYGYSFIEKPRYGKFNPERAKELGIPASRIYKRLQKGEIVNINGKTVDPVSEGIVGQPRKGKKVTYSADTMPCQELIELGMNSDVLIHEATFSKELASIAAEKNHSTSVDAAEIAKKMNAKQLILTHISSRYHDDANDLLKEAKEIFENVLLASDLMRVEVN